MIVPLTSGKTVIDHIRQGWELWHVSSDALPGRWELRRGREQKQVHWEAIERIRRHYLPALDDLVEERQEGRFTWSYVPKQRNLAGGAI
jgi:hypothetical protein